MEKHSKKCRSLFVLFPAHCTYIPINCLHTSTVELRLIHIAHLPEIQSTVLYCCKRSIEERKQLDTSRCSIVTPNDSTLHKRLTALRFSRFLVRIGDPMMLLAHRCSARRTSQATPTPIARHSPSYYCLVSTKGKGCLPFFYSFRVRTKHRSSFEGEWAVE